MALRPSFRLSVHNRAKCDIGVGVRLAARIFITTGTDVSEAVRPPPAEDVLLSAAALERGIHTIWLAFEPEVHYVSVHPWPHWRMRPHKRHGAAAAGRMCDIRCRQSVARP
jgi:hypothetical protein